MSTTGIIRNLLKPNCYLNACLQYLGQDFVHGHPNPTSTTNDETSESDGTIKVARHVKNLLLEECPWLRPRDLVRYFKGRSEAKIASEKVPVVLETGDAVDPVDDAPPDMDSDEELAVVVAGIAEEAEVLDLAKITDELNGLKELQQADEREWDFYTHFKTGGWLWESTGGVTSDN